MKWKGSHTTKSLMALIVLRYVFREDRASPQSLKLFSSYDSMRECHLRKHPLQLEDSRVTFTKTAGHAAQDQNSDLDLYLWVELTVISKSPIFDEVAGRRVDTNTKLLQNMISPIASFMADASSTRFAPRTIEMKHCLLLILPFHSHHPCS